MDPLDMDLLVRCHVCGEAASLDHLLHKTGHGAAFSGPNSGWEMACPCGLTLRAITRDEAIQGRLTLHTQLAGAKGLDPNSIFVEEGNKSLGLEVDDARD